MINGITVLNQYENLYKSSPGLNLYPFLMGIFAIVLGFFIIYILEYFENTLIISIGIGLSVAFIFSGFFSVVKNTFFCNEYYRTEYEVILDESVSLIEFYNKYEIIEQRGEIYVICEKEES